MNIPGSLISGLPIVSLQAGDVIGWLKKPVIDPDRLEIIAFICESASPKRTCVMVGSDIRQLAGDCIIIDSQDELAEPGDIIRLEPFLENAYTPLNKAVVTESGDKLGLVEEFLVGLETVEIEKLSVRRSLLRTWLGSALIIDRDQIVDVTPKQIIVRDATVKPPVLTAESLPEA